MARQPRQAADAGLENLSPEEEEEVVVGREEDATELLRSAGILSG